MTDRPVLFSAPMVLALLDGSKSQTRRVLKARNGVMPQMHPTNSRMEPSNDPEQWGIPYYDRYCDCIELCRLPDFAESRYAIGDRLWVRERIDHIGNGVSWYAADQTATVADAWPWKRDWLPSIHMPRGLSRLTLTVTDVRVQRVQEITVEDCIEEGCYGQSGGATATKDFAALWDTLNAKRAPWESNPWVVALTFTVARENIDA